MIKLEYINNAEVISLQPKLITNNPSEGQRVLKSIIYEIKKSDEFKLCVAFLAMSCV